jgi:hypothetical protein
MTGICVSLPTGWEPGKNKNRIDKGFLFSLESKNSQLVGIHFSHDKANKK